MTFARSWISNLRGFVSSLRSEANSLNLEITELVIGTGSGRNLGGILERHLDRVPRDLEEFWESGAWEVGVNFHATVPRSDRAGNQIEGVSVRGRIDFVSPEEFASEMENVRDWIEESWIAEFPDELEFWEKAVPFCRIMNGDYLALRPSQNGWEVVYLSHEDASETLASSLQEFLDAWEAFCYQGPESEILERIIDSSIPGVSRTLALEDDRSQQLRNYLRESNKANQ